MDTNDLSRETHTAIIDTAERFHHDLTLQFGVLASSCQSDNEYLDKSELMIKEWLTDWDLEEAIMDIFFDNPPNEKEFKKILDKILTNIENVRKNPTEQRKFYQRSNLRCSDIADYQKKREKRIKQLNLTGLN